MNPWTVIIAAVGIVMIIAGVKGTQGNLVAMITNKQAGTQTSTIANASDPTGLQGGGFSTGGGQAGGGGGVGASSFISNQTPLQA